LLQAGERQGDFLLVDLEMPGDCLGQGARRKQDFLFAAAVEALQLDRALQAADAPDAAADHFNDDQAIQEKAAGFVILFKRLQVNLERRRCIDQGENITLGVVGALDEIALLPERANRIGVEGARPPGNSFFSKLILDRIRFSSYYLPGRLSSDF
jgi:hypothetical protein